MWAVASAAERVMVIIKLVVANPNKTRTNNLPVHLESKFSSIEIEPLPNGLSAATRRYIGNAPNSVRKIRTSVAIGERAPAARKAIPGWYPS
jgi:hypothetical protein